MRDARWRKQRQGKWNGLRGPADEAQETASLESIGLRGDDLVRLCELTDGTEEGLVLITGPDEPSRLSTLYALTRWLQGRKMELATLEEPEEEHADGSAFAKILRPALHHRPDVIVTGELRDSRTAKLAVMAVMRGCLVLSTMEADGAPTAVERLLEIGLEPNLIIKVVKGMVSQRMVRRLCPRCRKPYTPSLDELAKLGISPGDYLFYRPVGCETCSGRGYGEHTGVFEVLSVTPAMRRAIQRQSREELEQAITESGFRSITDSCRRLVLDGVTSVQEVHRVLDDK